MIFGEPTISRNGRPIIMIRASLVPRFPCFVLLFWFVYQRSVKATNKMGKAGEHLSCWEHKVNVGGAEYKYSA